jgi:hypothetical protein
MPSVAYNIACITVSQGTNYEERSEHAHLARALCFRLCDISAVAVHYRLLAATRRRSIECANAMMRWTATTERQTTAHVQAELRVRT